MPRPKRPRRRLRQGAIRRRDLLYQERIEGPDGTFRTVTRPLRPSDRIERGSTQARRKAESATRVRAGWAANKAARVRQQRNARRREQYAAKKAAKALAQQRRDALNARRRAARAAAKAKP